MARAVRRDRLQEGAHPWEDKLSPRKATTYVGATQDVVSSDLTPALLAGIDDGCVFLTWHGSRETHAKNGQ